jgi:hypothetical protein
MNRLGAREPALKEHVLMTRTILSALLAVISVAAIGLTPIACQSGGVGDPCTPEDEYDPSFSGFKVTEENIESRSFQCQTRICLVNHFQGRVSCPQGQGERTFCPTSTDTSMCKPGESCVEASGSETPCDPSDKTNSACGGGVCNAKGKFCECVPGGCPQNYECDAVSKLCKAYVCHKQGNCQSADGTSNAGKDCCLPGADTPVTTTVCGQCSQKSGRTADQAVYCSCRCGPADGDVDDGTFNFCTCPSGYECSEIRRDFGISDPQITGKYCVKAGTEYKNDNGNSCGNYTGYGNPTECKGQGSFQ